MSRRPMPVRDRLHIHGDSGRTIRRPLAFRAVSAQSSMFPKSQSERKCIVAQQVSVKLVDDIDGSEAADTEAYSREGVEV